MRCALVVSLALGLGAVAQASPTWSSALSHRVKHPHHQPGPQHPRHHHPLGPPSLRQPLQLRGLTVYMILVDLMLL